MESRAERILDDAELKLLSMRKLCMKVSVVLMLCILVGSYLYATTVENLELYRGMAWFSCDPEINSSIVHDLSVKHPVTFCRFRYCMAVISVILLFPFVLEALTLTYYLAFEREKFGKKVGLVDGKLVLGKDYYLNNRIFAMSPTSILCFSMCFCWLLILLLIPSVCFALLFKICISTISRENTRDIERVQSTPNFLPSNLNEYIAEVLTILVLLLPEILLAYLLLPTSFLVVLNSQTPEDVLVNIVAIQIFSQLDEIIVRILLNPEVSLGMSLSSVVSDNPNYVPIPVYNLSEPLPFTNSNTFR